MSNCQKGSFSEILRHKCIIYCYSSPLSRTLNCTSFISREIHLLVSRLNNIPSCSHFIHKQDAKDGASIEARGVCDERFDKT